MEGRAKGTHMDAWGNVSRGIKAPLVSGQKTARWLWRGTDKVRNLRGPSELIMEEPRRQLTSLLETLNFGTTSFLEVESDSDVRGKGRA